MDIPTIRERNSVKIKVGSKNKMNEEQIVSRLKQNIPEPTQHTPAVVAPPEPPGVAKDATDNGMDELILYKLTDFFNEDLSSENKQWLTYIYEQVAKSIGTSEYLDVTTKIAQLLGIAGLNHSERKVYKLYQWIRLDEVRKSTEREMTLLGVNQ